MTASSDMFYWLFKSRSSPNKDPLIIWLSGGPGCSSEFAIFVENGPFKLNKKNLNVTKNKYSWNN